LISSSVSWSPPSISVTQEKVSVTGLPFSYIGARKILEGSTPRSTKRFTRLIS